MPDLSSLSDEELKAMHQGASDLSSMSDEELKSLYGQKAAPDVSKLTSAVRGFGQGGSAAFGDELGGALGAFLHKQFIKDDQRPFMDLYREYRDESRGENKAAREANPLTYGASEIAGGIAGAAPLGASAGTIKGAAALGGTYGLGGSEAELTPDKITSEDAQNAAIETALGAGVGGASAAAIKAVLKTPEGFRWASQKLREMKAMNALKTAGGRGGELTPKELYGVGGLLEKGAKAYDEGIIGPIASKKTMMNRAQNIAGESGEAMGDILSRADEAGASVDPKQLARNVSDDLTDFNIRAPSQQGKLGVIQDIAGDIRAQGMKEIPIAEGAGAMLEQRPIGARDLQTLKESLDDVARWNRPGDLPENAIKAQKYREGSGLIREKINETVKSALGDDEFVRLNQERLRHGTGKEFEHLLNRSAGQENAGPGGISVEPITKSLARPVLRKMNQATGYAQHVGEKTFRSIADAFSTNPSRFGKFAPVLQEAQQRGPAALSATFHVLSQQYPEMRAISREINGEEEPNQ